MSTPNTTSSTPAVDLDAAVVPLDPAEPARSPSRRRARRARTARRARWSRRGGAATRRPRSGWWPPWRGWRRARSPTHGVQPMASAAPVRKAPPAPARLGATLSTGSGSWMTPATTRPLKAMKAPAAIISSSRYSMRSRPTPPAPAPMSTKTTVNPATKSSDVPSRRRLLAAQVLDAHAGDEREVHRQQRQHAGRDEREQAGGEGEADRRQAERGDLDRGHRQRGRRRVSGRPGASLRLGERGVELVEGRGADEAVHLLALRVVEDRRRVRR